MPKVKIPRKNVSLDMTAMCDVAFLLLTFFILTTSFKPEEPVVVDTPTSVAETKLPDKNVLLISVDKGGRIFFSVDEPETRKGALTAMSAKYGVKFSAEEAEQFANLASFGLPIQNLKEYLSLSTYERTKFEQPGVPVDSLNNQLADWVLYSREINNRVTIAIKGDRDSEYGVTSKVIASLQDQNINKFHFVTGLEENPFKKKKK
jgi:biopolymer transport protein ExbD